jgi:hypothetical protein
MVKRHLTSLTLFLTVLVTLSFFSAISSAETNDPFDSYAIAVYDEILKGSDSSVDVFRISMSSDGSKIYFTGTDKSTNKMVVGHINSDGSNMKTYDAPDDDAFELVVNKDGSRSFFLSQTTIYKIEDNTVSKVVDIGTGNYVWKLDTTDSGDYVYCSLIEGKEILKFNHEDGKPTIVVQGNDIELEGNNISSILDFAVSGDGQIVVFLVDGYVFSSINGAYTQLTPTGIANDGSFQTILDVSGDGKKILSLYKDNHFILSSTDSSSTELKNYDAWGQLDDGGQKLFVSDSSQGLIVDTSSKEELILFPTEGIDIDNCNMFISADGKTISFTVTDSDYKSSIYVGHFYADADDLVPSSSLQSIIVDYSAQVSKQESSEELVHDADTGDGKVTEEESGEKSAGYALATPYLVSVLGLCVVVVNRKGRR